MARSSSLNYTTFLMWCFFPALRYLWVWVCASWVTTFGRTRLNPSIRRPVPTTSTVLQELKPAFSTTNLTTFYYPSFPQNNTPDILFSGDATTALTEGVIDLTVSPTANASSVGRATYAKPIQLYDKSTGSVADFSTHFTFRIQGPNNTGSGIAFFLSRVVWTSPENSDSLWLGLLNETLNNSTGNQVVAVEFDTFLSKKASDPSANHMGIDVNTLISNVTVDWQWDRKRQLNGEAWVWYNSTTGTLFAKMTNRNLQPYREWNLYLPIDLTMVLPEFVVVGFSSSSITETHQITSWNFTARLGELSPSHTPKPGTSKLPVKLIVSVLASTFVVLLLVIIVITMSSIRRRRPFIGLSEKKIGVECHREVRTVDENDDEETIIHFGTGPRRFSYEELAEATRYFSKEERLGGGGFGEVYRGILKDPHDQVVAVKRLSKGSRQGKKEFVSEVTVISQLRHRNLVRLVGWCHEEDERLLVYEYMDAGSLDSHLFKPNSEAQVLSWAQRMGIAMDVASALLYLHEEWEQCVIHRDVKASNVMIDSESHARLGDFGLARLVHHGYDPETTMIAGTIGYIAPECIFTGKVSKESDVYSFGVLLLEIVSGRRVTLLIGMGEINLVEWIWGLYRSGALVRAVDKRLGYEFVAEEAECLLMVGMWCTLTDKGRRPTIREAIQSLSFQAGLPNLPSEMPSMAFTTPAVRAFPSDRTGFPLQSGSTATGTTTTTMSISGSSKESSIPT